MPTMQRDLNKEAWCGYHLTSEAFFRGAVEACAAVRDFFKDEALKRNLANFGRNNQIYDSWVRHAREIEQAIEFTRYDDYEPLRSAAADICSTNRGVNQWVFMGWLGDAEPEYKRLASIAGNYASHIEAVLMCGLSGGSYWLHEAPNDPPERRNEPFGWWGNSVTILLEVEGYGNQGKTPEENYPHFRNNPPPKVFPQYAPDMSRPCKTGETVPWTGVWMPEGDFERLNLTFAIKGRPMTPVWRFVKSSEEVEAEWLKQPGYKRSASGGTLYDPDGEVVYGIDQCEITPITWYPLLELPPIETPFHERVDGGQSLPEREPLVSGQQGSGPPVQERRNLSPKLLAVEGKRRKEMNRPLVFIGLSGLTYIFARAIVHDEITFIYHILPMLILVAVAVFHKPINARFRTLAEKINAKAEALEREDHPDK
jgi:hypothetical protein